MKLKVLNCAPLVCVVEDVPEHRQQDEGAVEVEARPGRLRHGRPVGQLFLAAVPVAVEVLADDPTVVKHLLQIRAALELRGAETETRVTFRLTGLRDVDLQPAIADAQEVDRALTFAVRRALPLYIISGRLESISGILWHA